MICISLFVALFVGLFFFLCCLSTAYIRNKFSFIPSRRQFLTWKKQVVDKKAVFEYNITQNSPSLPVFSEHSAKTTSSFATHRLVDPRFLQGIFFFGGGGGGVRGSLFTTLRESNEWLWRTGFLAVVWFSSCPPPPLLSSASFLSFSLFLCVAGRAYWRERGKGVPNRAMAIKPGPL
jgi:hypothetical protein